MSGNCHKIHYILLATFLCLSADAIDVCKYDNLNKVVTFPTLLDYQASSGVFDLDRPTYQGNVVDFTFKTIDRLEKNMFISFESDHIIKMMMNHKGIKKIGGAAFNGLFCLHYLELRQNNISNIHPYAFLNLDNLRELDLSQNFIVNISTNGRLFYPLYNLKVLNLSRNSITTISDFDFYNLTNLEVLDLSWNKINFISPNVFNSSCLYSLKELYLDHNQLFDIHLEKWQKLKRLLVLGLAGNYLRRFDPAYHFSFTNLKKLNLSNNSLSELNVYALRKYLPKLGIIDISFNQWYCYELESIIRHLTDSKIHVLSDAHCITSSEYNYTTASTVSPSSSTHGNVINITTTESRRDYSEEVFVQNGRLLSLSKILSKRVAEIHNIVTFLCLAIILFVFVYICVGPGPCHTLYNRITHRSGPASGYGYYIDHSNL